MRFYEMAVAESRKLNQREVLKNAYEGLAKCNEVLGNYTLAYEYHLKHTALKDSLLNVEIAQKALMAELEFEKAKKESKILELQAAASQAQKEKTIYAVLFGSGFVFMITVVILIVRNNRQRTRSNRLLKEKNDEIEEQNSMLHQANQTKDKLFSIIGHDLRSPLVSLKGMLGMVVRNEVSDDEFKQFAPKLNRQVIGIKETLDNLLQWSTQHNGWSSTTSAFYVHDLIKKCTLLFDETAREKNITLDNEADKSIQVQGDPDQVELIFRNLVHNGIKFTRESGRVSIQAKKQDGFAVISVIDTGIGMNNDRVKNLLHDNNTLTTRGTLGERGTGLGFNLCREMALQNGGRIEVLSEEGKGSTFRVFIPLAKG
jgi:signal transduction histidine kinase